MRYFLDSYSWVEYLEGSLEGEKINELIKGDDEIYTLNLIIAEVVSKIKRKRLNEETAYQAILSNSKVITLNPEMSKESALLHAEIRKKEKNFGLVDAIIITSARSVKSKVVTGEGHFNHFKDVVFINK